MSLPSPLPLLSGVVTVCSCWSPVDSITHFSFIDLLVLAAVALLLVVTGGIAYLTFAEWRDRRRLDQDKRDRQGQQRR